MSVLRLGVALRERERVRSVLLKIEISLQLLARLFQHPVYCCFVSHCATWYLNIFSVSLSVYLQVKLTPKYMFWDYDSAATDYLLLLFMSERTSCPYSLQYCIPMSFSDWTCHSFWCWSCNCQDLRGTGFKMEPLYIPNKSAI